MRRVIRHQAGWISNPLPVERLRQRVDQLTEGAGHDVPLRIFAAPNKPDYWSAAAELGFEELGLLLPTKPLDESLRILDELAAAVAQFS